MKFSSLCVWHLILAVINAFSNPILAGWNCDPTILRVGDDYFMATSSMEYFPGLPIYHTTDLVNWNLIGHGINKLEHFPYHPILTSGGIYAPTLRYDNGTFFLVSNYVSAFTGAQDQQPFLLTTKDIFASDWSAPIYFDQTGIDPDILFDGDSIYLQTSTVEFIDSGNSTIWQSKVDLATGHSLDQPKVIYKSALPLNINIAEGAHIYKINGSYYLFTAEGGTEYFHREMVSRSDSPTGPWSPSPHNPLIYNGAHPDLPVQSTGHTDMVETADGRWYIVFLATRPQVPANQSGTYQMGRETFMAPITWTSDGWPIANDNKPITTEMPDSNLPTRKTKSVWSDDFSSKNLSHDWSFARGPYVPFYTILPEEKKLQIRGNAHSLTSEDTIAMVLQRQRNLNYTFSIDIAFQPTTQRHEAGIVAWQYNAYHQSVGVRQCRNATSRCLFTRTITEAAKNITELEYSVSQEGCIGLHISADANSYSLGYSLGNNVTYLATVSARWMAPLLGDLKLLTGALVGPYATGNSAPMLVNANFTNARMVWDD